ncbi:MAG: DUF2142 domain-containing protein [Lactovum sp.]
MEEITLSRKSRLRVESFEKSYSNDNKLGLTNEQVSSKSIHKFYLIIALCLSFVLAIGMPIFSEPDGQVHFERSADIVGIYTDLTQYGEVKTKGGLTQQIEAYQKGEYFDKYYLTKMQFLDESTQSISFLSYNYWGHLISGIGVWIGKLIYPSLGLMITISRLFSSFIYSLIIYFLLRILKRGRLFFATLMLCPVVINQFASLSYDSLSFVLAVAILTLAVNTVVDERLSLFKIFAMLFLSVFNYFAAKTNFVLLSLIFPVVLVYLWIKGKRLKSTVKLVFLALSFFILCLIGWILLTPYGGIFNFISRLWITFVNNPATWIENQVPHTFLSTFIAPYPRYNNMPIWLVTVWGGLLTAVCLSEEKFVEGKLLAYSALIIFILNLLAVYQSFLSFKTSLLNGWSSSQYILGVQGRYSTAFYLLAIFVKAPFEARLNIKKENMLFLMVALVSILSSMLLLFNTVYGVLFIESWL